MKSAPTIAAALQTAHVLKALPELTVDWNMNRYIGAVAVNTPDDIDSGYDQELFPIESIVEPNRPHKGINKARVGSGTIAEDYLVGGTATPNGRYYICDVDDPYKYWTSQGPSDASTGALTNCKPQVVYDESVAINKIVIGLENTWASPLTFSIQVTTVANPTDTLGAAGWTEVANGSTIGTAWKGTGQIVLYYNGSQWVSTGRVDNADKSPKTTTIRGVRIVVTALEGGYRVTEDGSAVRSTYVTNSGGTSTESLTDGKDSFFDLIEISARLEVDLTPFLITEDNTLEMSEGDQLYPIGTVTANQGSVTLSNIYNERLGLFSADNTDSPYHKYIDANAEMSLKYHYYDENDSNLGTINQFFMYTGLWTGQADESVVVELDDFTKFFDVTNVRAAMWEQLTVPEIVWRVLDSVGFTNYHIDTDADCVTEHKIPVFYTTGEQTVMEVLNELATASQTAIYFDSLGKLQVKTRDFALSAADAPVWNFEGESSPTKLADIINLEQTSQFEPNHFKITYQSSDWAPENKGLPDMQQVWTPEGIETLRGNPLLRELNPGDNYFYINPTDARTWPFEGMANIQGEVIAYKGKEFKYFTGPNGDVPHTMVIESLDDDNQRNGLTPEKYRNKNFYTGGLKITERGVWNSEEKNHYVEASGYSVRSILNGNHHAPAVGFKFMRARSRVQLTTGKHFKDVKDLLVATRGDVDDTPFFTYGTTMRFLKGRPQQQAGIVINNAGASEDGYYITLTPSKGLSGKERKHRNELMIYSKTGGKWNVIGGKGQAAAIGVGIDYEIDVTYRAIGGDHKIGVWINGKNYMNATITGAKKNAANGKFGLFARGKTKVEFEYLYAIAKETAEPMDDISFLDKARRGYYGDMWMREWAFTPKKNSRIVKRKTNDPEHRLNATFMDEFGPYVHEVREYKNIKFDPFPVLHSRLYNTNDWSALCLEYKSDPFSANFVLVNTARHNSVVNGDDSISFKGTGQSVEQVLTVFGRVLIIKEDSDYTVKNDDQIRRRGKIESEMSSTWIQSKSMAKDVGNWMRDHFSEGNENVTIEVFGNPLIELGDVVHVNYPQKSINADYHVLAATNTFDKGLTTSLNLRRRVS